MNLIELNQPVAEEVIAIERPLFQLVESLLQLRLRTAGLDQVVHLPGELSELAVALTACLLDELIAERLRLGGQFVDLRLGPVDGKEVAPLLEAHHLLFHGVKLL